MHASSVVYGYLTCYDVRLDAKCALHGGRMVEILCFRSLGKGAGQRGRPMDQRCVCVCVCVYARVYCVFAFTVQLDCSILPPSLSLL